MKPRTICPALFFLVFSATAWAVSIRNVTMDQPAPAAGSMVTFTVDVDAQYENPYDPDDVSLTGIFFAPGGARFEVPGFYIEPYSRQVVSGGPSRSAVRRLKIFVPTGNLQKDSKLTLLFRGFRLANSQTGDKMAMNSPEDIAAWKPAGKSLSVSTDTKQDPPVVLMSVTVADELWPGMFYVPKVRDWTGFDKLTFSVMPRGAAVGNSFGIEFYAENNVKYQKMFTVDGNYIALNKWREITWHFNQPPSRSKWEKSGDGRWQVRFTPIQAGTYRYRMRVKDKNGEVETPETSFTAGKGDAAGFVRISENDRRYLCLDSGASFLPVGYNMVQRDTAEYDLHLEKMQKSGANFMRVWMSPRGLGIEVDKIGRYRQDKAAQLDYFMNSTASKGVSVMLCLLDFREAKSTSPSRSRHQCLWKENCYSRQNGGPCSSAVSFFTNRLAKDAFKKRLRYVVARWGAMTNVFAWEFWNEVDLTDAWKEDPDSVRRWHEEMAEHLRVIDPFKHIVTTSFAGRHEDDSIWDLPGIHLAQVHFYSKDAVCFAGRLSELCGDIAAHKRPYLVGEFGRARNIFEDLDKEGVSLHNGIWAAVMAGSCGAAMSWWDRWIYRNDLYRHFAPLVRFARDINWPEEEFSTLDEMEISYADESALPRTPLVLSPVQGSWQPADFNKPCEFDVTSDGKLDKPELLSSILHGTVNHKDLHNPQTFYLDMDRPGKFILMVNGVSGHGGAHLKITLDGETKVDRGMADKSEDTATIFEYDGEYVVDVPKGQHTVVVTNEGKDWIRLRSYTITGCGPRQKLKAMGMKGNHTTVVWLRNTAYFWLAPLYAMTPTPIKGAILTIKGLGPRKYRVEFFDTQKGETFDRINITGQDKTPIPLPPIRKDLALKIIRTGGE